MKRVVFSICLLFSIVGVILSTPSPGHAQGLSGFTNNPYLQRGLAYYNDQKYDLAAKMFLQASKWSRSTQSDRITALQYLGFTYVIVGDGQKAQKYFFELLKLDPTHRLTDPTIPPKFVRFFNGVVRTFKAQREVRIVSLTPSEVPSNQPLVVKLRVVDRLRRTQRLTLFYRLENSPRYFQRDLQEVQSPARPAPVVQPAPARTTPPSHTTPPVRTAPAERKAPAAPGQVVKPKNRAKGTRPSAERFYTYKVPSLLFATLDTTQAYYFEFYAVAYDSKNRQVAKLGDANNPVRVKRIYVKDEKPKGPVAAAPPFYQTWWFWTITGVVVAGGVAAAVIPLVCCNPPPPPTTGEAIITIIK